MSKLLEANSVAKVYNDTGESFYALEELCLSVDSGEYVSIVGPSGAGKSTLLHVLGGLDSPSRGVVFFKGVDIYKLGDSRLSAWRNEHVGFVFQFYHLIEELNVLENVTLALSPKRKKSSLKKAQELLKYLGIQRQSKHFPSQLSGGQRQKTAIARALINDPQILLCDEPTGNLDKDSQAKVVDLLRELNTVKKKTIILVTHNQELAEKADRVVYMDNGQLNNQ